VSLIDLSDQGLFEVLCVLLVMLAGSYTLYLVARKLGRTREGFLIALPLFVAFSLRVGAAMAVNQLSFARDLRGGDELGFLARAEWVSGLPITGPESLDKLVSELHTFIFSLNYRLFDLAPPQSMLRTEMVVFSVLGLAFLSAAAWILALEPANIFFSSLLHKEPLMYLAEGLVVFGGAVLWKRGKLTALIPMIAGCLIAMATRPYAGWFLTAAAAAVILHSSLTRQQGMRSLVVTASMVVLIVLFIPVVWNASSSQNLKDLQQSQDANAADTTANLSLERVDYSTRGNLIVNLPKRIRDVIFRPYLWQTSNPSQQLGALGTLVVLACLALLAMAIARNRKQIMNVAGPLVYTAGFMLIAYSLSAGNAGTAYRYRTHLVGLAVCLAVVLLAHRRQEQEGHSRVPKRPGLATISRTRTAT
jgi:hypothetical protein